MGQTGADHGRLEPIIQEETKIPQTRDEQVPELRDGTKAREGERTVMELTKTAVSGPRGALDASITGARLHQTADRSISTSVSESRRAH